MRIENITITKGVTLRVADYESLRLEVTLEAKPDDIDSPSAVAIALIHAIDGLVSQEATKVGYRGIAKFVGQRS